MDRYALDKLPLMAEQRARPDATRGERRLGRALSVDLRARARLIPCAYELIWDG
jgi:hypothetical protein